MIIITTEENKIKTSYNSFMTQPSIKKFMDNGGKVFIATYKQPIENIAVLASLGHRHFAEKYLQEAQQKYKTVLVNFPDLELSFFGKLQTNKIKPILHFFHCIESISRKKEIDVIINHIQDIDNVTKTFMIQWNIGNEIQKNGVSEEDLSALVEYCQSKNFTVEGMMIIPPKNEDPIPYFIKAKQKANYFGLSKCQMGFSDDYDKAILCGTNQIRIGKVIFGDF